MIGLLSGWRGYALAAALAFAAAWAAQGWRWNADVATRERDQAQQIADVQALARATEQARWAAREGVINDAKEQAAAAAADANRARTASERLRQQVARLRAAGRDPAATGGGKTADDPIGVLAVVLGELDDRAGTLARYADGARIAGLACERAYESLRK